MHGSVVTYPAGAALVDTGVGGPPDLIRDWKVVNVTAADAPWAAWAWSPGTSTWSSTRSARPRTVPARLSDH